MDDDMETRPITLPKEFWAHVDRWRLERDASARSVIWSLIINELRHDLRREQ